MGRRSAPKFATARESFWRLSKAPGRMIARNRATDEPTQSASGRIAPSADRSCGSMGTSTATDPTAKQRRSVRTSSASVGAMGSVSQLSMSVEGAPEPSLDSDGSRQGAVVPASGPTDRGAAAQARSPMRPAPRPGCGLRRFGGWEISRNILKRYGYFFPTNFHAHVAAVCPAQLREPLREPGTQSFATALFSLFVISTPMRQTRCCARAASGHAAAPPRSVMNCLRFNVTPPG
jgi:hypothetical protein